ncbi:MAG: hypothetical protein NXI14_10445, partial [bacterium]|nr:hypothetical protein [bacterium]
LGMAVSVAAVGLSLRSEESRVSDAASSIAALDATARVLARKGRVTELVLDEAATTILIVDRSAADAPSIERILPDGITLEAWQRPLGTPIDRLVVDARGQSVDYQVRVSSGAASVTVRFAGLTGWHEVIRSER